MIPRLPLALVPALTVTLWLDLPLRGDPPKPQPDRKAKKLRAADFMPVFPDELERKLDDVNSLRPVFDEKLGEVAKRCGALLKEYPQPADQARIYFMWVQVLGQSVCAAPALEVELVQKALALPLDDEKRLRLYEYWGDALKMMHRAAKGEALVAVRPPIVAPYLKGLAECLEDTAEVEAMRIVVPPSRLPPNYPGPDKYVLNYRQNAEAGKAQKLGRLRDSQAAFEKLIAALYARKPIANVEIEKLAAEFVPDEAARKSLLARVATEVEKGKDAVDFNPPSDEQVQSFLKEFAAEAEKRKQAAAAPADKPAAKSGN